MPALKGEGNLDTAPSPAMTVLLLPSFLLVEDLTLRKGPELLYLLPEQDWDAWPRASSSPSLSLLALLGWGGPPTPSSSS